MPDAVEHWRRVERVLDGALDLEAGLRAAYLSRTCGDDPQLRAEVETWLSACDHAGGFLDGHAQGFALPLYPRSSGCQHLSRGAS